MEQRELNEGRNLRNPSYIKAVTNKWYPLLKVAKDAYGKELDEGRQAIIAMLLENTDVMLRSRLSVLEETDTSTAYVDTYVKFVFPVIVKAWANAIGPRIVSVQPMTGPVGAVFYHKVKFGSTKGGTTAGAEMQSNLDRYYTSEWVYGETVGTGVGASGTFTATLAWTPIRVSTVTINVAGTSVASDDGSGNIVGSNVTGTINYTTGALSVTFATAVTGAITADYRYNMELNQNIPEIYLDIDKSAVEAVSRKIKAKWSPEAAEDMAALLGIDAEKSIVDSSANEVTLEIDREIVMALLGLAAAGTNTTTWDAAVPATGVSEEDHFKSIVSRISLVTNKIHKATRMAPGNFLVTSPEIATILDTLPSFIPSPDYTEGVQGIMKTGVLSKRWTVYKDPFFTVTKILVGYKGPTFLDSGFVYAPYIPLQATPTLIDPKDFSETKGLRTRYATKATDGNFYGLVTVSNVPS